MAAREFESSGREGARQFAQNGLEVCSVNCQPKGSLRVRPAGTRTRHANADRRAVGGRVANVEGGDDEIERARSPQEAHSGEGAAGECVHVVERECAFRLAFQVFLRGYSGPNL